MRECVRVRERVRPLQMRAAHACVFHPGTWGLLSNTALSATKDPVENIRAMHPSRSSKSSDLGEGRRAASLCSANPEILSTVTSAGAGQAPGAWPDGAAPALAATLVLRCRRKRSTRAGGDPPVGDPPTRDVGSSFPSSSGHGRALAAPGAGRAEDCPPSDTISFLAASWKLRFYIFTLSQTKEGSVPMSLPKHKRDATLVFHAAVTWAALRGGESVPGSV